MKNVLINAIVILACAIMLSCNDTNNDPQAYNLYKKGMTLYGQGDYVEAVNILSESRDAAQREGNDTTLMRSLLAIGNIHTMFDDYEQAVRFYSTCYTKAIETNDAKLKQSSANNLLICHSLLGNANEAMACYRQLQDSPSRGKDMDKLFGYINQGLVAQAQKNVKISEHYFALALEYVKSHSMGEALECSLYGMIGRSEYDAGNYALAEQNYIKCMDIAKKGGPSTVLCSAYEKLAQLYRAMGDAERESQYNHLNHVLADSVFNRQKLYGKQAEISDKERRKSDEEMLSLHTQISQQWWIIGVVCTSLVLLVVLVIIIVRQNRNLISAQRLLVSKHREHLQQEQKERELRNEYLNAVEATRSPEDKPELLSTQQTEALLAAINSVMEQTDVISDPEFSLQQLANMVQSNTKYVSWVINTTYNKNFKTYLNDYRIEQASKILVDTDNYGNLTLRAICLMVGFKSTSSFNAAFKRNIGMTPSAYQKLYAE